MANLLKAIGFNPNDDENKGLFGSLSKIKIPQFNIQAPKINVSQPIVDNIKAIASVPMDVANWLKFNEPVKMTQNLPGPVQTIINPQIKNLRAAGELLNLPSYLLGGAMKAGREELQGTYQAPETNIKIKGKDNSVDLGKLIHPVGVGAVRGLKEKTPIFNELPTSIGVKPDSLPGLAIGLTGEILIPGPGGELKTGEKLINQIGKINKAEEFVSVLKTLLKVKPTELGDISSAATKVSLPDAMKIIKKLTIDSDLLKAFKKGEPLIGDGFTLQAQPATKELLINIDKSFRPVLPQAEEIIAKGKVALDKIKSKPSKFVSLTGDVAKEAKVPEGQMSMLIPEGGEIVQDLGKPIGEAEAKKMFTEWSNQIFKEADATKVTVNDVSNAIKTSTQSLLTREPDKLNDISNVGKGFRDVYRNFKVVFGDGFADAKRLILDPFDAAKGRYVDDTAKWIGELKAGVTDGLGIKKGSKLSELTQLFGEKKMTLEELQKTVPQEWEKVVAADDFFRTKYNELIGEINKAREVIYPGQADKLIPYREDYYRHFKEMAEGFKGALNIFDTPANISPELAGVSTYVKPKSKFLSLAQERLGDKTEYDAVGGFLDYIRSAAYAKNIDPQIDVFRNLGKELATATSNELSPAYGKVNNFIEYLDLFANQLSGKTNTVDRAIQSFIPGGRMTMKALSWLDSRFKSNTIYGNISSSLSQILNVPAGIADAGIVHSGEALFDMASDIFTKKSPITSSTFIKERYMGKLYNQFDESMLKYPKKFATWMITVLDEAGTKFIWNAEYRKALAEGAENAVKFADDATRGVVAGRGIGEVPLFQQAKMTQLVAPFQIEVANQWWVMKDWVDAKQFQKFITYFLATHIFNSGIESVTGNRPALDPIMALQDAAQAYEEEPNKTKGILMAGGRLAGEGLSNLPYAQYLASIVPERQRQEFFGRQDPTRYGTGPAFLKAIKQPQFFVLPPFGGGQIKKTLSGLYDFTQGYADTPKGNVKYPIADTAMNLIRTSLFGPYSTPEAQKYFDEELSPLGSTDSVLFKNLQEQNPEASKEFYDRLIIYKDVSSTVSKLSSLKSELEFVLADPSTSDLDKQKAVKKYEEGVNATAEEIKRKVPNFNPDEFTPIFKATPQSIPEYTGPNPPTDGDTSMLMPGIGKVGGSGKKLKVKAVGITKPSFEGVGTIKVAGKKKSKPMTIKDLTPLKV